MNARDKAEWCRATAEDFLSVSNCCVFITVACFFVGLFMGGAFAAMAFTMMPFALGTGALFVNQVLENLSAYFKWRANKHGE